MKIAYIMFHPIHRNDGVVKKVQSQKIAFESEGHDLKVFAFSNNARGSEILNASIYHEKHFSYRFKRNKRFINDILEFHPDIIYCRYDTFNRNLYCLRKQGFRLIFEYNTYDLTEAWILFKNNKTPKEILKWLFYLISRRFWINQASGHVFVTNDLLLKYNRLISNRTPRIAIPNSISFENFRLKDTFQNVRLKRDRIVFIGTPNQPWHGLDIIISLSYQLPNIHFDIIGYEGEDSQNITYHGYLSANQFIPIICNSSACLGPLGIERYKLNQSSPLKVREYIALGAPVILGYEDFPLSFVKEEPLILQLSSKKNNWSVEIEDFLQSMKNIKREYKTSTTKLIDSKITESNRVNFVTNI